MAILPSVPMSVDVVKNELTKEGSKAKLMQKYGTRRKEILDEHGGSVGDMPVDADSEFYQLEQKIKILNGLENV